MKKLLIIMVMVGLMASLSSCRDDKDAWTKFYGYSRSDIVGTYSASTNDDYYFDDFENYPGYVPGQSYCIKNAEIKVDEYLEQSIAVTVTFPEVMNMQFTGVAQLAEGTGSVIDLHKTQNNTLFYQFNAEVYRNVEGDLRLHGFVRKQELTDIENDYYDTWNWYFDVEKD